MRILVINGPNLNLVGRRNPKHYGKQTLEEMNKKIAERASELNITVTFFQSNHEGFLIDYIQKESPSAKGIIINPGALTHYSYSLYDALIDAGLPVVEVHLSEISRREPWRKKSVVKPATVKQISGKKEQGYLEALEFLARNFKGKKILL